MKANPLIIMVDNVGVKITIAAMIEPATKSSAFKPKKSYLVTPSQAVAVV